MEDFTRATRAASRFARRLDRQGIDPEALADAMFAEAAGRWAAITGNTKAIQEMALLWTAIGAAALIEGGENGRDG